MSPLLDGAATPLATALGLALLHLVWQGFVVGALVGGVLIALRGGSPVGRYWVCVAGMATLLVAPVITTWFLLRAPSTPWISLHLSLAPALAGSQLAARFATPLLPVLPALPFAWGAGVLALQIRMLVAWSRANRLRRVGVRPASPLWQREFERLRERLAISQSVRLLESSRVVVPAVVGCLRPVVLMPASLATGLSPDEIRGLLAHELAHVGRHDYLVNVVQCLFESLLFFHPVTWWLSGRLREEREFCCDDVALPVGGGAFAYARTLSSLEELRSRTALPVLSAQGGTLMTRILRILGAAPHRSRAALAAGVVTVVGGVVFGSLMAAGCFRGESAAAGQAALTGPADDAVVETANAVAPMPVDAVLAKLDQAAVEGKISQEILATIRGKIENGQAKFFTASCGPDGTCELPADCVPGDCAPADCVPGECDPAACLELIGSEDEAAVCVVVECVTEEDCASFGASAAMAAAPRVEIVELKN